ncbi:MAG: PaaI family thioesterase [Chloroflexi bacterium]|nr:PaaI family thioesterase [Chloroflexota bacterium]MXX80734.1 PaaI family thioesterase [Chloroflexota bacterium]MYD16110.1 PaaI family thioesterase [Chloroflexota bacterium]MYF21779.1 PaaI family thioesterase [Chloroflexota bacterium]
MTDEIQYLAPLPEIEARYGTNSLFGERFIEISRGKTVLELPITRDTAGGARGGVHGGILASLADIGVVAAVLSTCRVGEQMQGTSELNISYLRPAVGSKVRVESTVIKKGRSLAVGDVDLLSDQGKLIAKARVTYAISQTG